MRAVERRAGRGRREGRQWTTAFNPRNERETRPKHAEFAHFERCEQRGEVARAKQFKSDQLPCERRLHIRQSGFVRRGKARRRGAKVCGQGGKQLSLSEQRAEREVSGVEVKRGAVRRMPYATVPALSAISARSTPPPTPGMHKSISPPTTERDSLGTRLPRRAQTPNHQLTRPASVVRVRRGRWRWARLRRGSVGEEFAGGEVEEECGAAGRSLPSRSR